MHKHSQNLVSNQGGHLLESNPVLEGNLVRTSANKQNTSRINYIIRSALPFALIFGSVYFSPSEAASAQNKPARSAVQHLKVLGGKHKKAVQTKREKETDNSIPGETLLLQSMKQELDRSFSKLSNVSENPLYFLSYRVYDSDEIKLAASFGALSEEQENHRRTLDVEARVGDFSLDNTHKLRENMESLLERLFTPQNGIDFSIDNDASAIRTALWLETDAAFKSAQRRYLQVKANQTVKVSEEDHSADFSPAKPVIDMAQPLNLVIDKAAWENRLRRLSAIYKEYPDIIDSDVQLNGDCVQRYIVNSEGSLIQTSDRQARIITSVSALADDGMKVNLYDSFDVLDPADLPDDKTLEKHIRQLAQSIIELRNARIAEPYVGPAILRNRAAGVFFHEILGHRVEGHRQKDEEEGRTFAKKIGEKIMPNFVSVYDDPNLRQLNGKPLAGYYHFDNEGILAQKVSVVDHGILRNFLMGRSPINNFNSSNGHSRAQPGLAPVARQGNLVVECSNQVPYEELRKLLIEEAKKQGKPYGLVFDEIAGGFAITQTFMPQSFELLPLQVTRVWVDGRPDELLRGVNLVGTPLASLETIVASANDTDTFNGVCGAESGWVPVSASSPSLLVRTLEIAREWKEQSKPPILPPPALDSKGESK
jgi:predicted Zn-dependent protease